MSASASAPAPKQQIQIPVVSMDQVLAFVQQAVEQARSGALWTALDQVNQVVSQRTEISAGMLASEFFFGPRGSSSTVGRALLVLNGFSLASFAFHSADRVGTLRAATGLALKGEAEVLAHGLMLNLGAAGLAGLYAGLAGPENNVMSVLALGAAKGALAFVALSFAGGARAPCSWLTRCCWRGATATAPRGRAGPWKWRRASRTGLTPWRSS